MGIVAAVVDGRADYPNRRVEFQPNGLYSTPAPGQQGDGLAGFRDFFGSKPPIVTHVTPAGD